MWQVKKSVYFIGCYFVISYELNDIFYLYSDVAEFELLGAKLPSVCVEWWEDHSATMRLDLLYYKFHRLCCCGTEYKVCSLYT